MRRDRASAYNPMTRLTVKTLDLQPGDVMMPRPNSPDRAGDTVTEIEYPPHSQLTNAAVIHYNREGQHKMFLAGIETEHEIERP